MARAAGSGTEYVFVLKNLSTGRYDPDVTIKLTSVTTIIKRTLAAPQLVPWAYKVTRDNIAGMVAVLNSEANSTDILDVLEDADMLDDYLKENRLRPDDVRDEAAERGTREHGFLERLAETAMEDADAADNLARTALLSDTFNGFSKGTASWWLERSPTVVASEKVLISLEHAFCGSVDLIWRDDQDRLVVTDLKTRGAGKGAYSSDHIQCGAYALAYEEMENCKVDLTTVLVVREDGTWLEEETTIPRETFIDIVKVYRSLKGAR